MPHEINYHPNGKPIPLCAFCVDNDASTISDHNGKPVPCCSGCAKERTVTTSSAHSRRVIERVEMVESEAKAIVRMLSAIEQVYGVEADQLVGYLDGWFREARYVASYLAMEIATGATEALMRRLPWSVSSVRNGVKWVKMHLDVDGVRKRIQQVIDLADGTEAA